MKGLQRFNGYFSFKIYCHGEFTCHKTNVIEGTQQWFTDRKFYALLFCSIHLLSRTSARENEHFLSGKLMVRIYC